MSSKRASVNPLALFLKPQSPAESWLLSSRTVRSRREREAAQGAARGSKRQRQGARLMKRPVGRPCT